MDMNLFKNGKNAILGGSTGTLDGDIAALNKSRITPVAAFAAEMPLEDFIALRTQEIFKHKILAETLRLSFDGEVKEVRYPGFTPEQSLKIGDIIKGRSGSYFNSVNDPDNYKVVKEIIRDKTGESLRQKHGASNNFYTAMAHDGIDHIHTPDGKPYDIEQRKEMIRRHFTDNVLPYAAERGVELSPGAVANSLAMFLKPNSIQRSVNDLDMSCQETKLVSEAFSQCISEHLQSVLGRDVTVPAAIGRMIWEKGGDISNADLIHSIAETDDGPIIDGRKFSNLHEKRLQSTIGTDNYYHPLTGMKPMLKEYGVELHIERGYGLGFAFYADVPTAKADLSGIPFTVERNNVEEYDIITADNRIPLNCNTVLRLNGEKFFPTEGMYSGGKTVFDAEKNIIADNIKITCESSGSPILIQKEMCDIITTSSETLTCINDYSNIISSNEKLGNIVKGTALENAFIHFDELEQMSGDDLLRTAKENFEAKLDLINYMIDLGEDYAENFNMTRDEFRAVEEKVMKVTDNYYEERAFIDNLRTAEQVGQKLAQNKEFILAGQDKKMFGNYADTAEFAIGIIKAAKQGDAEAEALREVMIGSYSAELARWMPVNSVGTPPHDGNTSDMDLMAATKQKINPDYDVYKEFSDFIGERSYMNKDVSPDNSIRVKLGWADKSGENLRRFAESCTELQKNMDTEVTAWGKNLLNNKEMTATVAENMPHIAEKTSLNSVINDISGITSSAIGFFNRRADAKPAAGKDPSL